MEEPLSPSPATPNVVLDYHTPPERQPGDFAKWFARQGPWWIKPSWRTLVLLAMLVGAVVLLRRQPPAWTRGVSIPVSAGIPGDNTHLVPLPQHNAVFCIDPNGIPIICQPWKNQRLLQITSLPGQATGLSISGDESSAVIPTRAGWCLANLNSGNVKLLLGNGGYLPPVDPDRYPAVAMALSHDASHLATLAFHGQVMLWDITGRTPRLLGTRLGKEAVFAGTGALEFSPDDQHLLVHPDNDTLSVLDSTTLDTQLFPTISDAFAARLFAWLEGGKYFVVGSRGGTGMASDLQIFDCQTGKPVRQWHIPYLQPGSVSISPDGKHLLLTSQFFGGSVCIDDPLSDNAEPHPCFPFELPTWCNAAFFPDGRLLTTDAGWDINPIIVDLATDSHVATLQLPANPTFWNPQPPTEAAVISRDTQHVALLLGNGQLQVYDHTGSESRWGMAATPLFALVALLLMLSIASLYRDGARQCIVTGPMTGALLFTAIGFVPALLLCGAFADRLRARPWDVLQYHWPLHIWIFFIPLGVLTRAGSRVAARCTAVLAAFCIFICLVGLQDADQLTDGPFSILDRAVRLEPAALRAWLIVAGSLAAMALVLLVRNRRENRLSLPAPVN